MAITYQSRLSAAGLLIPLTLANGVAVSTLYWGQAVMVPAVGEFGRSAMMSVMPGATLAGYAGGVAVLAALAGDLTAPRGLALQFVLLVVALCAAAGSPTPLVLTIACLFIGAGCALTQRLLASATSAMLPAQRARTIGWIIAAGLCGIVLARSCVPDAAKLLGWRGVFWVDALAACACGVVATSVVARVHLGPSGQAASPLPRAASLWREEATLRRAALQQAAVFAAFNMGWAIVPRLFYRATAWPALSVALIALLGAAAALIAGRLCGRFSSAGVARAGALGVCAAIPALVLGLEVPLAAYPGMVLLDAGTQVALVANQARAQSLASTPAMRGRLAAIVTTVGFMGGALGAALGNLLAWIGLIP